MARLREEIEAALATSSGDESVIDIMQRELGGKQYDSNDWQTESNYNKQEDRGCPREGDEGRVN